MDILTIGSGMNKHYQVYLSGMTVQAYLSGIPDSVWPAQILAHGRPGIASNGIP